MQKSAAMELESKVTTSQISNEIMAEVCEAEVAVRNQVAPEENLKNDKNKKGKV